MVWSTTSLHWRREASRFGLESSGRSLVSTKGDSHLLCIVLFVFRYRLTVVAWSWYVKFETLPTKSFINVKSIGCFVEGQWPHEVLILNSTWFQPT